MHPRTALLPGLLALAVGLSTARAETPTLAFEVTAELEGHTGLVRTLAFHPEGTVLASGGPDRSLRLWRVGTGEAIATLMLPRDG